jgi:hypothetical protein
MLYSRRPPYRHTGQQGGNGTQGLGMAFGWDDAQHGHSRGVSLYKHSFQNPFLTVLETTWVFSAGPLGPSSW